MEGKTIRLKLSVGGLPNVGKTSIVNRVVLGSFTADYATTIGVDFRIKEYQVGSITAKTYIWDQCGAERFSALKYLYMKKSNAICLCFSLNQRWTFQELPKLLKDFQTAELKCPIYLFGCKSDLEHRVSKEEIYQFADKHKLTYFECSAKENAGVNQVFKRIVEEVVLDIQKDPELIAQLTLPQKPPPSNSSSYCHV